MVEDDPGHAALIQAAFSYRFFPCHVHVTGTSEEAIEYLLGEWPFDKRSRYPLPDLVILDVGLPGMSGLEFLQWLSARPEEWSAVPVVVFSAFLDPEMERRALDLGARECLPKPSDFNDLLNTVAAVLQKWGRVEGAG